MMMKKAFLAVAAVSAVSLVACAHKDETTTTSTYSTSSYDKDADNTGTNQTGGLTANDQSNAPSDRETSRLIRRELMEDGRLSVDAKNVKIITIQGRVTLRGPVDSEEERRIVAHHARKIAGRANVDNQLVVR